MSSSPEQRKTQQAWREHHASNPKWPSEREKEKKEQAFRARLAEVRRNRAARPVAAAAAAPVQAGTTTTTPAVYIDNTNARQASSSETETVSASSSRSTTIRGSSNPSPPTSQSPSPVINGVLPAPAACAAQATATCSEEPLADAVVPIRPPPSSIPLANMFDDDEEDVDVVDNSKIIGANVETSTKASSSPVKKRKLPFGDDDSEGDSDFEGHRPAKKAKASDVDAAASSKCKSGKDAIKPSKTNLTSTTIVKHASALENGPSGCYQNTVLHLLSSIPAFAAMGTETPLKGAKAGIAQAFSRVMYKILKNTSGKAIDTAIFRKACGDFLGSVFDGKTQQDADEFLCKLVDRLQKERPDLELAAELEAPEFVRKAKCAKCGVVKEIDEMLAPLVPQMNATRPVSFNSLLEKQIDDTSAFTYRSCKKCKLTNRFETEIKAARLTMRSTPPFLKVVISRFDPEGRSPAKNRTKVVLERECSFLSKSGETVRYELVAAAGHNGRTSEQGHWMALRKIENKWFQCDSAGDGFGGVKRLEKREFDSKNTHVGICLFKKIE